MPDFEVVVQPRQLAFENADDPLEVVTLPGTAVTVVPVQAGAAAVVEVQVPRIIEQAVINLNGDPGKRILVKDTAPTVGDHALQVGDIWFQPVP